LFQYSSSFGCFEVEKIPGLIIMAISFASVYVDAAAAAAANINCVLANLFIYY